LKKILKNNKPNIIISGGGTGGHLFPAIAIAQAIKAKHKDANILFVGAKGRIEEKKVPEAGFAIELLNISGFQRKLSIKTFTFFIKLASSLLKSRKIIRKFKPDVAVGVGGYASGPLLQVATKRGIPALLQEQNSFPGITNRLLANKVQTICVAYDGLEKFFPSEKIIKTGNPVREKLISTSSTKTEAIEFFGLNPNKKVVLSLGGSGGARSLNNGIAVKLNEIIDSDVQIIWQTGKYYIEESKEAAAKYNSKNILVTDFITHMDLAYKAADVVISRAGAGTISELCILKKAVILVPSPNVAEDHQTKNAKALLENNAAILVKDSNTNEQLIGETLKLVNNESLIKDLSENISKFAFFNSANIIADEVLKLIVNKND